MPPGFTDPSLRASAAAALALAAALAGVPTDAEAQSTIPAATQAEAAPPGSAGNPSDAHQADAEQLITWTEDYFEGWVRLTNEDAGEEEWAEFMGEWLAEDYVAIATDSWTVDEETAAIAEQLLIPQNWSRMFSGFSSDPEYIAANPEENVTLVFYTYSATYDGEHVIAELANPDGREFEFTAMDIIVWDDEGRITGFGVEGNLALLVDTLRD